MVRANDILLYANSKPSFSVADIVEHLTSLGMECSANSIACKLRRLVIDGILMKVGRGLFAMSDSAKHEFAPHYDDEMSEMESFLRKEYPFLDNICIWNILDIKRLSHYVTRHNYVYVEVDRDAVESVFDKLTAFEDGKPNGRRVFINPTANDCYHYAVHMPSVIVKPLVTEAPVLKYNGNSIRASLEKILVDVVIDDDLDAWHGYESLRLYETAFSRYEVNVSKMLRYALRRGRKQEISEIINNRHQIYD